MLAFHFLRKAAEGMVQEMELKLELVPSGCMVAPGEEPFWAVPNHSSAELRLFRYRRGRPIQTRSVAADPPCGEERIQTVKSGDGSAAHSFTREEWQRPVAGDVPVLDDPEFKPLLAGNGDDLARVFELYVDRHLWNVMEGDATIEVALDLGKVVAADREAPLSEIELERKTGSPAALFALARQLNLIAPTYIGVLSKAERGYRLLGPAPNAIKASVTPLAADMSAATAFAHLAAACLKQFRLNEMALSWSRDADALHQARVSLRRLRSLFSICKSMFDDSRFDRLREELRWLA
jgi:inorganic triphosphatase YgiF